MSLMRQGMQMTWPQKSYSTSWRTAQRASVGGLVHCCMNSSSRWYSWKQRGSPASRLLSQRKNLSTPTLRWCRMYSRKYRQWVTSLNVTSIPSTFRGGSLTTPATPALPLLSLPKTITICHSTPRRLREGISEQQKPSPSARAMRQCSMRGGILLQRRGLGHIREKPLTVGFCAKCSSIESASASAQKQGRLGKCSQEGDGLPQVSLSQKGSLLPRQRWVQEGSQSMSLTAVAFSLRRRWARDWLKDLSCGDGTTRSLLVRQASQVPLEQQLPRYKQKKQAKPRFSKAQARHRAPLCTCLGLAPIQTASSDQPYCRAWLSTLLSYTYSLWPRPACRSNLAKTTLRQARSPQRSRGQPKQGEVERMVKKKLEASTPRAPPTLYHSASLSWLAPSSHFLCPSLIALVKCHTGKASRRERTHRDELRVSGVSAMRMLDSILQYLNTGWQDWYLAMAPSPSPFSKKKAETTRAIDPSEKFILRSRQYKMKGAGRSPEENPSRIASARRFLPSLAVSEQLLSSCSRGVGRSSWWSCERVQHAKLRRARKRQAFMTSWLLPSLTYHTSSTLQCRQPKAKRLPKAWNNIPVLEYTEYALLCSPVSCRCSILAKGSGSSPSTGRVAREMRITQRIPSEDLPRWKQDNARRGARVRKKEQSRLLRGCALVVASRSLDLAVLMRRAAKMARGTRWGRWKLRVWKKKQTRDDPKAPLQKLLKIFQRYSHAFSIAFIQYYGPIERNPHYSQRSSHKQLLKGMMHSHMQQFAHALTTTIINNYPHADHSPRLHY